jgi:hypothetical protein
VVFLKTLLLVFAFSVATNATPLSYQTFLRFSQLSQMVKLNSVFQPPVVGYPTNFQIVATSDQLDKTILFSTQLPSTSDRISKISKHPRGYYVQLDLGSQRGSAFFIGFKKNEIEDALKLFQKIYSIDRRPSSSEFASEEPNQGNKSTSDLSRYAYAFSEGTKQCVLGAVDGINAILVDPFVMAGRSIKAAINDPKQYWENSVEQWENLKKFFKNDFEDWLKGKYTNFRSMSQPEKNRVFCEFLGGIGAGSAVAKMTRKVTGAAIAAAEASEAESLARLAPEISAAEKDIENIMERDLFKIQRGSPEVARRMNERTITRLNNEPKIQKNPARKTEFTKSEIDKLYQRVVNNPVAAICNISKYASGGGFCFGRATAAHIEAIKSGLQKDQIRKVWVLGKLVSNSVKWKYHVTTAVRGPNGSWYAIDPIMEKPMRIDEWSRAVSKSFDKEGNMRIFVTDPTRFSPYVGKYEPRVMSPSNFGGYFSDLMKTFKEEAASINP